MRFLAIDLGDRRTGLACADDVLRIPAPIEVIEASTHEVLMQSLAHAVDSYAPDALVIGLPLNMDGSEGPRAKMTRDFALACEERFRLPVHFQDERLTSHAAETSLNRSGRTHAQKRRIRDALAACELLKDFLAQRG